MRKISEILKGQEVGYSDDFANHLAKHPDTGVHDPAVFQKIKNYRGIAVTDTGYGDQTNILWHPGEDHSHEDFDEDEHIWGGDYEGGSYKGVKSAMDLPPGAVDYVPHIANEFNSAITPLGETPVQEDKPAEDPDWTPEGWDLTARRITAHTQHIRRVAIYGNDWGRGTGNGYGHFDGAGLSPLPPIGYSEGQKADPLTGFWNAYVESAEGDVDLNNWMTFVYEHNVPLRDHEAIQFFDDHARKST